MVSCRNPSSASGRLACSLDRTKREFTLTANDWSDSFEATAFAPSLSGLRHRWPSFDCVHIFGLRLIHQQNCLLADRDYVEPRGQRDEHVAWFRHHVQGQVQGVPNGDHDVSEIDK